MIRFSVVRQLVHLLPLLFGLMPTYAQTPATAQIPIDMPEVITLGSPPVAMAPIEPLLGLLDVKATMTAAGDIAISRRGRIFTCARSSRQATVDGDAISLPIAPFMVRDITYVPLQPLISALGGDTKIDAASVAIVITLPDLRPLSLPYARNTYLHFTVTDGKASLLFGDAVYARYTQLYVMRSDGSALQRLSYHLRVARLPRFSADGSRWVAFSESMGVPLGVALARTLMSGKAYATIYPCTSADLTPDGATIIYTQFEDPLALPQMQLASLPFNGGAFHRIARGDNPIIAPDGRSMTCLASGGTSDAFVTNLDGTFSQSTGPCEDRLYSPDGRILLVLRRSEEKKAASAEAVEQEVPQAAEKGQVKTKIISYRLMDDGSLKKLTLQVELDGVSEEAPLFTPDSRQVIFARRGAGLWMMQADRSQLRQLTTGTTDIPLAMPDAGRLLFLRQGKIYRLALADNVITPLANAGEKHLLAPRSANTLYYLRYGQVFLLRLDTGKTTQLTKGTRIHDFTISPDGRHLFLLMTPPSTEGRAATRLAGPSHDRYFLSTSAPPAHPRSYVFPFSRPTG